VVYVLAFLIGVAAGLRAMLALAAVSWGAYLGALRLTGSWLAFLGQWWIAAGFTALAVGELITDQLPTTPSRTVPVSLATRVACGALAGAAIGANRGHALGGALAGMVGAVVGTFGGGAVRARLANSFGRDRPAALLEDAVAVIGAFVLAWA
jgi:uncharacterized membrane protein